MEAVPQGLNTRKPFYQVHSFLTSTILTLDLHPVTIGAMHSSEPTDIQFYERPTFGYQVITLKPTKPGRFFTLYTVIEYQYAVAGSALRASEDSSGSRCSYPARNEAEASR
jgi:hypothetical protein